MKLLIARSLQARELFARSSVLSYRRGEGMTKEGGMAILKKVLVGLIGLVLIICVVGFALPRQVHVERSVTIGASPDVVFPHVNSLRAFNAWSPWAAMDPDMDYTYSGPDEGLGMRVEWVSDTVGTGSQEIVESVANERVRTTLDFGMQGVAEAAFVLTAVEDGTHLTWSFDTDMGPWPTGRYMGLLMDKWVGGDYDKGLANLKALVEKEET